jgi:DnaA family protein
MLQPRQLALQITLDDSATFDNFHVTSANLALLNYLRDPAGPARFTWLWGAPGAGCSHLLQAMCQQPVATDHVSPWAASFYVPLRLHADWHPDILLGLESLQLVCLDDVDAIAGLADWEEALFHLFNRLRESGTRLLVAARTAPREAAFVLPDLLSRLQSGVVFQVHEPDDEDKLHALCKRAGRRGLELSEDVARYILQRTERGNTELFALLERLDSLSLQRQRRVSIALVRDLLQNDTL